MTAALLREAATLLSALLKAETDCGYICPDCGVRDGDDHKQTCLITRLRTAAEATAQVRDEAKPYTCPVCAMVNPNWKNCDYGGCPDGRS